MKRMMGITGTFVALVLTASWAHGQAQQVANAPLTFAAKSYQPVSVNDNQWIVGNYITGSGSTQRTTGFLNVPGSASQSLVYPDSKDYTRADGINNSGTIVGDYFGSDGVYHGYTYSGGSFSEPFNLPGFNEKTKKFSTSLFGISNNGSLAGAANPSGSVEGFVQIGSTVFTFYGAGTDNTYAYAVNDAGTAVGQYFDSSNLSHGFVWTQASGPLEVAYPGAAQTSCTGVNDFGTIVGTYTMASGQIGGFEVVNGNFVATDLIVVGISSAGYLVGSYTVPGGASTEGFLLYPVQAQNPPDTIMAASNAMSTSVYGVDVSGDVVGAYTDSTNVSHGMLYTAKGKLITIDSNNPDAAPQSTVCYAINAPDDIVCNYADTSGNYHGAVYNATTKVWTEISISGAVDVLAYGINKLGHLAGTYVDSSGNQYGFLLTSPTGEFTQLRVPHSTFTVATGINIHDEVVAWWGDINNYIHSSSYLNTWVEENLPGATNVYIGGIDDHSDLSYLWVDSVGNLHGGYYNATSAKYYLWDYPSQAGTRSYGINYNTLTGNAEMVGRYYQSGSTTTFNGYSFAIE